MDMDVKTIATEVASTLKSESFKNKIKRIMIIIGVIITVSSIGSTIYFKNENSNMKEKLEAAQGHEVIQKLEESENALREAQDELNQATQRAEDLEANEAERDEGLSRIKDILLSSSRDAASAKEGTMRSRIALSGIANAIEVLRGMEEGK
jgi:flagellar biosynthesis/type III secretory pathway M-ring protein FliF/YscJ